MSEEEWRIKKTKQPSTHSSLNKNTNKIHNSFIKKRYIFALSTWKFVIYSMKNTHTHPQYILHTSKEANKQYQRMVKEFV